MQQEELCQQIKMQYTLDGLAQEMSGLSQVRQQAVAAAAPDEQVNDGAADVFDAYVNELLAVYRKNKLIEDEMKAKVEEKKQQEA